MNRIRRAFHLPINMGSLEHDIWVSKRKQKFTGVLDQMKGAAEQTSNIEKELVNLKVPILQAEAKGKE